VANAAALLGTVVAPVVHFYGAREDGHVRRETQARVFVTSEDLSLA